MRRRISLIAIFALAGCAPTATVLVAPQTNQSAAWWRRALDIRFLRVDIDQMPIYDALDWLSAGVRKVYGEDSPLSFSYSPSVGGTGVNRFTFHGSDVTVREVLDEFCRQTSMVYSVADGSIQFDNHPPPGFQPEVRRPRKA